MTDTLFNRDSMARSYAGRHLKTDPGIKAVYYLPAGAPDREIRLLEVNDLIPEFKDDALQPLDFGVDIGSPDGHTLLVLDVTPAQWERIERQELALPRGWSLDGAAPLSKPR